VFGKECTKAKHEPGDRKNDEPKRTNRSRRSVDHRSQLAFLFDRDWNLTEEGAEVRRGSQLSDLCRARKMLCTADYPVRSTSVKHV